MFQRTTPVVRNLLILNGIFFVVSHLVAPNLQISLAGYYPSAPQFQPWQVITHMFMHAGVGHIFFNMFALYLFGSQLERVWGPQRFLNYYLACGLGAFFLHELVVGYGYFTQLGTWFPLVDELYPNLGYSGLQAKAESLFIPVVGASGAIYGLLLAFGMLFPNTLLDVGFVLLYFIFDLIFPGASMGYLLVLYFLLPRGRFSVPMKARYVVIGFGVYELFRGLQASPHDFTAHFAHLGGMIFGYLLLKKWQQDREVFY